MTLCADTTELDGMEIAPGHTVAEWKALDLAGDNLTQWLRAIKIFATRIRRRFIDPVDVLIAHEIGQERGTFGFAILAIDCLLVETLQAFREGCIQHKGRALNGAGSRSEELIVAFLVDRFESWFDEDDAKVFYLHCRCAIHHSGQTDGDFRVKLTGPLFLRYGDGSIVVNRTAFHEALKREFHDYLAELSAPMNSALRVLFRTKMDAICGIAAESSV